MSRLFLVIASLSLLLITACGTGSDVPVDGGRYMIVSKASGMALDVPSSSKEAGKQIVQWTINNKDKPSLNQVWKLVKLEKEGQWKIISEDSKLCLDVQGQSLDNNAPIVQWSDKGNLASNQIWTMAKASGGYRISSLSSGKMLTVFGVSTEKGASLVQFEALTVKPDNQIFRLIAVK
jgi:hypothetical protein